MNTQYLHELKQPGIKFTDPANTELSRHEVAAYFTQLELLRLDFIEHISSCRESVAKAYIDTIIDVKKILQSYSKHVSGPAGEALRDWLDVFPSSVVFNPSLMARIVSGYSKSIEIALDFLRTISPAEAFRVEEEHEVVHKENTEPKPVFFEELLVPQETLPAIFSALKQERWIAKDTSEDVFMFYFTGHGTEPRKHIRWIGSLTLLVLFLKEISADKRIWKKAATVFETIKKGKFDFSAVDQASLRSSFSQAQLQDKYKDNLQAIARVIGKE